MNLYTVGTEIRPDGINYADMSYDLFDAREVLHNGSPSGIYHIKVKDINNTNKILDIIKKELPTSESGLIDPEKLFHLEYSIFLIIKDKMILNSIVDIFCDIDKNLKGGN